MASPSGARHNRGVIAIALRSAYSLALHWPWRWHRRRQISVSPVSDAWLLEHDRRGPASAL